MKHNGFTIVELLIVIVVIGILAALVITTLSGAQDKAKLAKVQNDIAALERAIVSARIQADQPLTRITNHGCTGCDCKYSQSPVDALPYYELPTTHACWTRYYSALDRISAASGAKLDQLKAGDPWGSPYWIDENEYTNNVNPCAHKDILLSVGKDGRTDGGTRIGRVNITFYTPECN